MSTTPAEGRDFVVKRLNGRPHRVTFDTTLITGHEAIVADEATGRCYRTPDLDPPATKRARGWPELPALDEP